MYIFPNNLQQFQEKVEFLGQICQRYYLALLTIDRVGYLWMSI